MHSNYGPALLLGALIGSAMLLDDFITPERKVLLPRVVMFHQGEGLGDIETLVAEGDHSFWIIKSESDVEAEIQKDVITELSSGGADTLDETQQLIISVGGDADDQPTWDLAADIGTVIDTARAEGREPTKVEIEAAISAITGNANSIDVKVFSTKD